MEILRQDPKSMIKMKNIIKRQKRLQSEIRDCFGNVKLKHKFKDELRRTQDVYSPVHTNLPKLSFESNLQDCISIFNSKRVFSPVGKRKPISLLGPQNQL